MFNVYGMITIYEYRSVYDSQFNVYYNMLYKTQEISSVSAVIKNNQCIMLYYVLLFFLKKTNHLY